MCSNFKNLPADDGDGTDSGIEDESVLFWRFFG